MTDAATLVRAWEAGTAVPPAARGAAVVAVLGAAGADVLDLPLPALAAAAVACHTAWFGDRLDAVLSCPRCPSRLELTVRPADLAPAPGGPPPPLPGLMVRTPSTLDLIAAGGPDGRDVLLARCVTVADGRAAAQLTPREIDDIDDFLEAVAGPALPVVRASCPDCGADAAGLVDAAGLLWQRVEAAAPALLADVARLAAAFGWSEADILALRPVRRDAYLALVAE